MSYPPCLTSQAWKMWRNRFLLPSLLFSASGKFSWTIFYIPLLKQFQKNVHFGIWISASQRWYNIYYWGWRILAHSLRQVGVQSMQYPNKSANIIREHLSRIWTVCSHRDFGATGLTLIFNFQLWSHWPHPDRLPRVDRRDVRVRPQEVHRRHREHDRCLPGFPLKFHRNSPQAFAPALTGRSCGGSSRRPWCPRWSPPPSTSSSPTTPSTPPGTKSRFTQVNLWKRSHFSPVSKRRQNPRTASTRTLALCLPQSWPSRALFLLLEEPFFMSLEGVASNSFVRSLLFSTQAAERELLPVLGDPPRWHQCLNRSHDGQLWGSIWKTIVRQIMKLLALVTHCKTQTEKPFHFVNFLLQ